MWYKVSIVKISWRIKILQRRGNKSWQHRTVTCCLTDKNTFSFSQADFFLTLMKTIYFNTTQLKRRQPISISNFCVTFLSACLVPQKLSVFVSVYRRRQLKESVYGDKLQQYNTGGGMTNIETLNKLYLHICSHTPNRQNRVYICTF